MADGELRLGDAPPGYRSGFVSVVGRPNVGKSTLVNRICGRKVAITSPRPQTTRNAIRGVHTTDRGQAIFVDTPGLHKPRSVLGERLNEVVRSTMGDVDVILFVVDAADGVGSGDAFIGREVVSSGVPVVCVLNKIDVATPANIAAGVQRLAEMGGWTPYGVSALEGAGVDEVVDAIVGQLPEGPLYYPPDTVTDQPERQVIAELVREKVLELTREEVPHSVAVVVEDVTPRDDEMLDVDVVIYVERPSQKAIVIGDGGRVLKEVGTKARAEIEPLLGSRVYLHLRVKVERRWQRRAALVERFGYGS